MEPYSSFWLTEVSTSRRNSPRVDDGRLEGSGAGPSWVNLPSSASFEKGEAGIAWQRPPWRSGRGAAQVPDPGRPEQHDQTARLSRVAPPPTTTTSTPSTCLGPSDSARARVRHGTRLLAAGRAALLQPGYQHPLEAGYLLLVAWLCRRLPGAASPEPKSVL